MDLFQEVLLNAGLDTLESKVYTTLINNGALSVLEISSKSNLKRTNIYNVLENLEKKDLVKKVESNKSTKYFPESPKEIENLLVLKEEQINSAKNTFELLIDNLQSKYNTVSHKPVINYYTGLNGLKKVYQEILEQGQDILILRSTFDDKKPEIDKLIQKQIVAQVKRNIHAKVIGPPEKDAKDLISKFDKLRLVEERFVINFPFNLPAQIIIYGNKCVIATIRNDIVITQIDNKEISQTFRVLFDFIWEYISSEHSDFVNTLEKN